MKRGRLTPQEKERIDQLALAMDEPNAGPIARVIDRKYSTVNWYMLMAGLIERKPGRAPRPYRRNGKLIHPFSEEHDAFILELRSKTPPMSLPAIARALTEKFNIKRSHHSVHVRLTLLAAAPEKAA